MRRMRMRKKAMGPDGSHMVEVTGKTEVYVYGKPYKPGIANKEDERDVENLIEAFEHGENMLMAEFEVLKYGKFTIIREVMVVPDREDREDRGKVIDSIFASLPEAEEEKAEIYEIGTGMKLEVSGDEIDNILMLALDGGISYWCDKAEIKDHDHRGCVYASQTVSRGAALLLHDEVEDVVMELDREKVLNGLARYIASDLCRGIEIKDRQVSTYCLGIFDADIIIKVALFGKIMYEHVS